MGYEVKDVNPKEKMWLIRSSSRLIGPYSLEEVVDLLTYNQISFVDEMRRPKSRWNFVRDFPYLTAEDIQACLAYAADRERRLMTVPVAA